jgi:hypothetical protein
VTIISIESKFFIFLFFTILVPLQFCTFTFSLLLSCLSSPSLKYLLWTGQKELWPIYLGPIQSKAQTPRLAALLVTHPFPARGVHGASKTGLNEPQRLFARSHNNLSGGYTSHDFVTARAWCAITTALQPSTSIYRGTHRSPQGRINLPLLILTL